MIIPIAILGVIGVVLISGDFGLFFDVIGVLLMVAAALYPLTRLERK